MGSCSFRAKESAKSQISKFNNTLCCDEYVCRFYISVHDTSRMHVIQGTTYLNKVFPYCLLRYQSVLSFKMLNKIKMKKFYQKIYIYKVKVTSFGRAAFSYAVVQPLFDILFPLIIGLHQETSVHVSPEKLYHSWFCVQPTYGAQTYQTCIDTALPGYQFTPWSSGASEIHFLRPEK